MNPDATNSVTFSRVRRWLNSSAVVIDQGISSVTNLVVLALAASTLSLEDFGAVSVAFAAYSATVVLSRGAIGEMILVQRHRDGEDQVKGPLGAAALLGLAPGLILVLAGVVLGGPIFEALVPLGLLLPALFVQDTARYCAVATNRPWVAVANDATRFALGVGLLLVARSIGLSITEAVLAWAISGLCAALVACLLLRSVPSWKHAKHFLARNRALWPTMMADSFITNGSRSLAVLAIAAAVGLAESGGLRVAQVAMGPIAVLVLALPLGLLPRLRAQVDRSPGRVIRTTQLAGAALAAVAALWTLGLANLPESVGQNLLGSSWIVAAALLVPVGVYQTLTAFSAAVQAGFRALHHPRDALAVRLVMSPLLVVMPGLVGIIWGVTAAAWSLGAVELCTLVLLVVRLRRLSGNASADPIPHDVADDARSFLGTHGGGELDADHLRVAAEPLHHVPTVGEPAIERSDTGRRRGQQER